MVFARLVLALLILTAWLALGLLYLGSDWTALERLPSNSLAELLLIDTARVALFWLASGYWWLALGYYQLRTMIRRNSGFVEKAAGEAAKALELIETQAHRQRHEQLVRIRAAQPRWEVTGCIAGNERYEINLRNMGAPASRLSTWKKDLPIILMLSTATFVGRGDALTIKVVFTDCRPEEFEFALEYCDAAGDPRTATVKASAVSTSVHQEEF